MHNCSLNNRRLQLTEHKVKTIIIAQDHNSIINSIIIIIFLPPTQSVYRH